MPMYGLIRGGGGGGGRGNGYHYCQEKFMPDTVGEVVNCETIVKFNGVSERTNKTNYNSAR